MPNIFFKYKSLKNKEDVIRFYDIVTNNRLYFSPCSVLNDPLEGTAFSSSLSYAGCSMPIIYDFEDPIIKGQKNCFKIVSVSSTCFSPQMWAYYCDNYNGVCLCYSSSKSFSSAKNVEYDDVIDCGEIGPNGSVDLMDKIIYSSLYKKQSGWAGEKEWRIVDKTDELFFKYDSSELMAIIVGHRVDDETVSFIKSVLNNSIPIFKTHPGIHTRCIKVLPYDYYKVMDGVPFDYISNEDELYNYIKRRNS